MAKLTKTGLIILAASQTVYGYTPKPRYTFGQHKCVMGYNMQAPDHPRKTNRGAYSIVEKSTVEECAYLCDSNKECKAFEFGHNYGVDRDLFRDNDCLLNSHDDTEDSRCSTWNLDVYRESL